MEKYTAAMTICLSVPVCDLFGAGTCGKYLLREFAARTEVRHDPQPDEETLLTESTVNLINGYRKPLTGDVEMPLIQFGGPELNQQTRFRGKPNVGYVFCEWDPITAQQKENLKAFDVLAAGSEWNARVIRDAGFECAAVQQGVDRRIFSPMPRMAMRESFVVYSGGKWEHRKAQDLVIRAVRVLQQRHADIMLMASWFNIFSNHDHYAEARKDGIKLLASA